MRKILMALLFTLAYSFMAFAGWENDEIGTRFTNEDGTYKVGWYQDVNGKWYYLDDNTGYALLNTTTPDGFLVDGNGEWIQSEGSDQNLEGYDNRADFSVTAYSFGPSTIKELGFSLPVTVHYNNAYECGGGRNVKNVSLEVSKDGALYVKYTMDGESGYRYGISIVTKYIGADGACEEKNDEIETFLSSKGKSDVVRAIIGQKPSKQMVQPISAEIYINQKISQ